MAAVEETEGPAIRERLIGRHRGFHEHTETLRLRVLVKTAMPSDHHSANGRDLRFRDQVAVIALRRKFLVNPLLEETRSDISVVGRAVACIACAFPEPHGR